MDRDVAPGYRLRLIVGKYRVTKLRKGKDGFLAAIDLGNSITMALDCPVAADIRLNDILTFYTEVPYAEPSEPPKQ